MIKTTISEVHKYVDQEVRLGVWVANKRSSGKIAFLQFVMEQDLFKASSLKQKYQKKFFKRRKP